jgi:glycerol dehydrogenase-like iron-containing ADH family enzyme
MSSLARAIVRKVERPVVSFARRRMGGGGGEHHVHNTFEPPFSKPVVFGIVWGGFLVGWGAIWMSMIHQNKKQVSQMRCCLLIRKRDLI